MTENEMPDALQNLKRAIHAFEQDYQNLQENRIWIALMQYLTTELNNDCWYIINTTISEKNKNYIEQHRGIVKFLNLLRPILLREDSEPEKTADDSDLYP